MTSGTLIVVSDAGASTAGEALTVTKLFESKHQRLLQLERFEFESTSGRSVVKVVVRDRDERHCYDRHGRRIMRSQRG